MDIPALSSIHLPWPPQRNPHADHYLETSLGALIRVGLVKDHPADRVRRELEGILERDLQVHPDAGPERLVAAGTFSQWRFFLGDQHEDAREVGRDPLRVEALMTEAFDVLRAGLILPSPTPFARFTDHLRVKLLSLAPEGWWDRFIEDVEESIFAGSLEAARCRARGATPPLDRLLELRLHDSAVFPAFDIIEIASGLRLTEDVLRHPAVIEMRKLAGRHIAHLSDLISYHKEVPRDRGPCNLVDVLVRDGGMSPCQAVRWIVDTANADVRRFIELEASLPRWRVDASAPAQGYIDGMKHWMTGNLDFNVKSLRCKAPDSPSVEPRAPPTCPSGGGA